MAGPAWARPKRVNSLLIRAAGGAFPWRWALKPLCVPRAGGDAAQPHLTAGRGPEAGRCDAAHVANRSAVLRWGRDEAPETSSTATSYTSRLARRAVGPDFTNTRFAGLLMNFRAF